MQTAMTTVSTVNPEQTPNPRRRKRPFGVNAIIVISALSFVYGVAAAVIVYYDLFAEEQFLANLVLEQWLVVYFITSSVIHVVIIVGLWRMKRWGWFLVMVNTGVGMFLNIWAYFYSQPNYFAMVMSVLIVLYMNQREVQQAFIELPPHPRTPPTIT